MLIIFADAELWTDTIEKRDFTLGWLGNKYLRVVFAATPLVLFYICAAIAGTLAGVRGEGEKTALISLGVVCAVLYFGFGLTKNLLKVRDRERWQRSFVDHRKARSSV